MAEPLTDLQIASVVLNAGFREADAVTAVAIALAESGGRYDATNRNGNGSTDYGLFQINSIHRDILAGGNWINPLDNARMARRVWSKAGGSFRPWVVYTTGRYALYLPRARAAVESEREAPVQGPLPENPAADLLTLTGFFTNITNPDTWRRLGMALAGGLLILFAVFKLTGDNKVSETTKQAVMLAVTRKPKKAI